MNLNTLLAFGNNNSLLQDNEYIHTINKKIHDVIEQYALPVYSRESLKDIPPDILQFTINDQLFLDTLLMEIRGKSISYSSYKKKTSRKREEKIKQEIISLEQNLSEINSERLELLKKELQLITEDKRFNN